MTHSEAYDLIKIHYQFTDNGHYMDAFTFNKCESQVLAVLKETAKLIKLEVVINVEAPQVGSLRDRLKISLNDGIRIKVEWIIAAGIGIFLNPIGHSLENAIDWGFEYLKDGAYIHLLKTEKERLELEKEIRELRQDSLNNATQETENRIKRKVSNFYAEAKRNNRIVSIGFESSLNHSSTSEPSVFRHEFDSFIITDNLEDESLYQNVRIDIVAPVLKKGNTKWRGVYNNLPISFLMKDVDFKNSVIGGSTVFTGGSYIMCDLNIYTSVNEDGETHVSGYEVVAVHSLGINDAPLVVTESEKKRKRKEKVNNQPTLFDGLEENI